MAYVAITGGSEAIDEAAKVLEFLRCKGAKHENSLGMDQIQNQLRSLHSRVLSEGAIYDPELVSLAIKQAAGDSLEATYYLRAYRATRPRLGVTPTMRTDEMRVIRRISSAFKDIPGGQVLGPTPDYSQRLFRFDLLNESLDSFRENLHRFMAEEHDLSDIPETYPKVVDFLRKEGMLKERKQSKGAPFDITREALVFPVPRSAGLSIMSRAETGSILALAYSNMRGYGDVHPTIAELRVGYVPLCYEHPSSGENIEAGEVLITECEIVASHEIDEASGKPFFTLGYGACMGHNEAKAISMAILDRSMEHGKTHGVTHPSEDTEYVLMHIDAIDSMGFAIHYKMPHYVTFESDIDRLHKSQQEFASEKNATETSSSQPETSAVS